MRFVSPPPIIIKTFGIDWIQKVELTVGKVEANHFIFPDIAEPINNLSKVKGFETLKKKILNNDDELFQLLTQLEFSSYIVDGLVDSAELEDSFSTHSGKHPDLRIRINGEWYYFELTKVMEYRDQILLVRLNDILSSFLNSLMINTGMSLDLSISFLKEPTEKLCKNILTSINEMARDNSFKEMASNDYVISFKDGKGVLDIHIPKNIGENKIKDKFVSEYEQLNDGDINIILIDITSLIGRAQDYNEVIRQLYRDYQNDHITATILVNKRYVVEELEIQQRIDFPVTYNPFAKDSRKKAETIVDMIVSNCQKLQ